MNPETNRFEKLYMEKELDKKLYEIERHLKKLHEEQLLEEAQAMELVRPDGTPVPKHWSVFQVGEHVVIKNYTFEVKYIGETAILFEPVGPVVVGEK